MPALEKLGRLFCRHFLIFILILKLTVKFILNRMSSHFTDGFLLIWISSHLNDISILIGFDLIRCRDRGNPDTGLEYNKTKEKSRQPRIGYPRKITNATQLPTSTMKIPRTVKKLLQSSFSQRPALALEMVRSQHY